ncbi:DinB family protein [Fictibacillus phosphorivorans]|uniref:DinB family protein n=1 Tax=Fictibacillus phosphorivorans TaxID=1221500 RepID=UPI0020412EFB|nr:DinB family protein [Fictibacillus phosphorivorans]MCM3720225.1 DinB family protein [Fictibacillus phosphorivorans]MCM3777930.1 DinB family protein [Fictibacillus phosphorivorans]
MNDLQLIETYKNDLPNYSVEQLRHIPETGVWSLCQMYNHVIVVANEYLDQVDSCASVTEEQNLGKTEFGERLFQNGGFPPIKIRLPGEMNAPPSNKETGEELMRRLEQVMERMQDWERKVDAINPYYKIKHGGFGWLNAREWYDLIGMHFRHHLRQKSELERRVLVK